MTSREKLLKITLLAFAFGSPVISAAVAVGRGDAGNLADTTSGKVLASALLALGYAAFTASRDPWRHRLIVRVLIVFTALATLSILYRLAFGPAYHHAYARDPAWYVLPFAMAPCVLFLLLYPRRLDT
jgi:hypothetical protein